MVQISVNTFKYYIKNVSVWRNKKAEEHYVQEFEANHMRELEKISSKFEIGIERSNMISKVTRPSKDIRSVDNPEDLYEICKNWEAEDLQVEFHIFLLLSDYVSLFNYRKY